MKQKLTHLGFCKRCNQQVFLTRKEMDVCLAVILGLFTIGIGLLVYLVIYYRKPENRCSICGSQDTTSQVQAYQATTQPQDLKNPKNPQDQNQYCAFCGEKIDRNSRFCDNCGSKVEKK